MVENKNVILEIILLFFGIWIIIFALIGITSVFDRDNTTSPVEGMNVVDSIATLNDSLKVKVNNLDSIKNAKVIEVYSLDNDSVVKLFYELVRE